MSEKVYIPFGAYRPDPPDFDSPDLHTVKNMVPLFGGYRSLNTMRDGPQILPVPPYSDEPMTGALAALITTERETILSQPSSDIQQDSWVNQDGDQQSEDDPPEDILYKSVEGEFLDRGTYIEFSKDYVDTDDDYICAISGPDGVVIPTTAPWFFTGYYTVEATGAWEIEFILEEGITEIARHSASGVDSSEDYFTETILQPAIDLVLDPADLQIRVQAAPPAAGSDEVEIEDPFSKVSWSLGGVAKPDEFQDWIDTVTDKLDATYLNFTTFGGKERGVGFALKDQISVEPGIELRVRIRHQEFQDKFGYVLINGTYKQIPKRIGNKGWDDVTFLEADLDSKDEVGEIQFRWNTTRDGARLTELQARFFEVEIFTISPLANYIRVNWLQLQSSSGPAESVDEVVVYAGSFNRLWRGDPDTTRFEELNTGLTTGGAWYFTQFGQSVIATNFQEDVKVIQPGDALFSDLVTTPTPAPRGRYVATCHSHMILGDINFAGNPAGQANEVWWAGFNAPESMEISKATGADRQPLYHTVGRVTGLTGGDACLVFKPLSIIRLDYVGGQFIFQVRVLSMNIGTVYSKSIVQAGHDTYFFTGADFARIRGYQQLEFIGESVITRSIIDSIGGQNAINTGNYTNLSELENTILGAYDDFSEMIWWFFRAKNDVPLLGMYAKVKAVCYSIKENRWAAVDVTPFAVNQIIGFPSYRQEISGSIHRGVRTIQPQYIPGGAPGDVQLIQHYINGFTNDERYIGLLRTKVATSNTFAREPEHNIQILGVRPRVTPTTDIPPEMSIKIYASERPLGEMADITDDRVTVAETFARDMNTDGWFPFDISGEYLQFDYNIPVLNREELDFEGAEYMYTIRGRR